MKRLLIVGLVMASASVAMAVTDRFGNPLPTVWRSSFTQEANGIANIGTGSMVLHNVIISSASVAGTGGIIYIYNSTGTMLNVSTMAIVATDGAHEPHDYDMYLSSGFSVAKVGNAAVTYLFEWLVYPASGQSWIYK